MMTLRQFRSALEAHSKRIRIMTGKLEHRDIEPAKQIEHVLKIFQR